ncbi:pilus assembly protein TadG-related protein [Qipengyuania gaetbuli]|uniref:pilus assembly protein TadG-related protein n=1 Tax=Qipengyuania gaetbuli TaxID=266952 RepID=UPI001CD26986|nr:pilus assembly protein TadG-related protein [Qipengyuania gaetbuli]MCA0911374.1 pilus assembly protein TadG-related protein [Qipengyuania gaetbuli]
MDTRFAMLRNALQFLKQVRDDKRGNMLVLVAASLVPIVGTMGLAVDAAQWISWRRDLHSAADAGAIAGALAMKNGENVNAVVSKVLTNNTQHTYTVEAIETPPTAGPFAGDNSMVRVVLSVSQPLPFSSLFLSTPPTISVEAVAQAGKEVPNCMIALDTSGIGLTISGSASVDMNCGLASNSNFDATTSDKIRAGALSAVGSVNAGGAITADTAVHNGTPPVADPLAGTVTNPNLTTCNAEQRISSTTTLFPGCYRGITVNARQTLVLSPGTYYIGEKGLTVNGQALLVGDGVTLVFTNTDSPFNPNKVGTFTGNGTADIRLSAPDTGPYAGIIIHQDSRTPAGTTMFITGDNGSIFDGSIYAPSNTVGFSGNSGMNTDCLQIVSRYITFTGNTTVVNRCRAGRGVASFFGDTVIRLRQ